MNRFVAIAVVALLLSGAVLATKPGKVTICHVPPGAPDNAHTIVVSSHAQKAHMDHGDSEGSCPTPAGLVAASDTPEGPDTGIIHLAGDPGSDAAPLGWIRLDLSPGARAITLTPTDLQKGGDVLPGERMKATLYGDGLPHNASTLLGMELANATGSNITFTGAYGGVYYVRLAYGPASLPGGLNGIAPAGDYTGDIDIAVRTVVPFALDDAEEPSPVDADRTMSLATGVPGAKDVIDLSDPVPSVVFTAPDVNGTYAAGTWDLAIGAHGIGAGIEDATLLVRLGRTDGADTTVLATTILAAKAGDHVLRASFPLPDLGLTGLYVELVFQPTDPAQRLVLSADPARGTSVLLPP